MNHSNFDKLMGLYAQNATLIPTFSDKILYTSKEIQEYFVMICGQWQGSVEINEESLKKKKIKELYLMNGEYTFQLCIHGEHQTRLAQFSFLIDPSREDAIILHHSSPRI